MMIKPQGDWKLIFAPQKHSKYINDHTIFQDKSGCFHLLGTANNKRYIFFRERYFVEAISDELDGRYQEEKIIFKSDPHPGIKISPFVIFSEQDNKFHLFFGPGIIHHYTSDDGTVWKNEAIAIRAIWPFTRDPFIMKHDKKYIMFLTVSSNKIAAYESSDLRSWKYIKDVFRLGKGSPRSLNSSCESPSVIKHGDYFYLFTTIVPALRGCRENYNNTFVFRSKNILEFGAFAPDGENKSDLVGQLDAHAPEVFTQNEEIFYTSCGWSNMPKPSGITQDGVYMRKLIIK